MSSLDLLILNLKSEFLIQKLSWLKQMIISVDVLRAGYLAVREATSNAASTNLTGPKAVSEVDQTK